MITSKVCDAMTNYYDWWTGKYSEDMYGFVFFSTSLLEYAGCTVFTESGLDAVYKKYRKDKSFKNKSDSDLKNSLRFSPCDAPHHMGNLQIFENLNAELSNVSAEIIKLEGGKFEKAMDRAYSSVLKGIIQFRGKRIPINREDILVTMLWGDISNEEIFAFIKSCNSKRASKKFIDEFKGRA